MKKIFFASILAVAPALLPAIAHGAYATVYLVKSKALTLSATPDSYDAGSGKWNYKVDWNRIAGKSGSIYINGNLFVADASGSGENFTGYSLKPKTSYRFVYYSDA